MKKNEKNLTLPVVAIVFCLLVGLAMILVLVSTSRVVIDSQFLSSETPGTAISVDYEINVTGVFGEERTVDATAKIGSKKTVWIFPRAKTVSITPVTCQNANRGNLNLFSIEAKWPTFRIGYDYYEHFVFPMRAEEDAAMQYYYNGSGGQVTFEEFAYLSYLFEFGWQNESEEGLAAQAAHDALMRNHYPGTIREATAEKYGLPEGVEIPTPPNFNADGSYNPPPLVELADGSGLISNAVNEGRVEIPKQGSVPPAMGNPSNAGNMPGK